ncbi:hypothetical protein QJS10_CPB17g01211 [Acorus calamus]|uniref:Transposase MuDR plant domain-containing protein n=1 Tax=Acorus calamus TaxID=4465 RepID=A0AAV9CVA0_ACOCL|nr:hypothetical protein QJS10_CPB17g01211 [Acorus calamus]
MDEDTLYKVTFIYDGHWKQVKSAYGQRYVEGRQFTDVLDSCKITLIDLWEDIGPWSKSSNPQRVTFTYMVPNSMPRQYVEITDDSKLLQIFKENRRTKRFTLYVVQNEDTATSQSTLPISQIASERGDNEVLQQVLDDVDDLEENSDAEEEYEAEQSLEAEREEESEEENEMEDAQEEVQHEMDLVQPNDNSCSGNEVLSDNFEGEFVEIDSERPKMVVGSRFPSVEHFRDALNQYCVTNEFAVKYLKNERCRVTAKCKVGKCNWRIHASVLPDEITFEVKTLNEVHTCTSVNKVGNEMVTSRWLATKMVPILHKTPELGASKLKMEVQNKYNLTLPYTRVQKARAKAIELIHGKPAESYRLIPES